MLHRANRLEKSVRVAAGRLGRDRQRHLGTATLQHVKDHHHHQSAQLLNGMLALFGLCGTMLYGPAKPAGLYGPAKPAGLPQPRSGESAGSSRTEPARMKPEALLFQMGGRRIMPFDQPALYGLFGAICWRAGLRRTPALYYLPTPTMNAFALGGRDDEPDIVVVTAGLLANLTVEELAGILAHEVAHIRNRDTLTMALAHDLAAATELLSLLGLGRMRSAGGAPDAGLVLCLVPAISKLLQLALLRIREHDADIDAILLSGGAGGLIRALEKLERHHTPTGQQGTPPARPIPAAVLLRSHPETRMRVRLLAAVGNKRK